MHRTAILCTLCSALGCTAVGQDDSGSTPSGGDGGADLASGRQCELDPAIGEEVSTVRVAADGAVWLSSVSGDLYRYQPTGGDHCELAGQKVWDDGSLQDVTDFDLDAAGNAHLLVFFSTLVRIRPDGTSDLSCEVPSGHGIAVNGAGDRVYSVAIGTESLVATTVAADTCTDSTEPVALAHAIGTAPIFSGEQLAVNSHDPSGTLPPGFLLDPVSGGVTAELGTGTDENGETLVAIADLAVTATGYWAVGAPDGALWHLDEAGVVSQRIDVEQALPVDGDPDPTLYAKSVGYSATGPSYVSAGFVSLQGVWQISLSP